MEKISDTMSVSTYDAYAAEQNNIDTTLSERVKKAQEDLDDRNMRQREKERNSKNLQGLALARIGLEAELLPEENTAIALEQSKDNLSKKNLHEAKGNTLNKLDPSQASLDDLANLVGDPKQSASSADVLSKLHQSSISSTSLSKKIIEKATENNASATNSLLQQGSLAPLLASQEKINHQSNASQKSSVLLANTLHQTRLLSAMQSQAAVKLDGGAEANNLIYRFDKWGATHSVSVSSIDGRSDLTNVILRPSDELVGQRLTTHLPMQEHGANQFLVKDYRDQSSDRQPSQQAESSEEQE